MILALVAASVFDLVPLAKGVHAAVVRPRPPMYVFANALVIEDDEAVTVVDTHQSPSAAEALLEAVAELTDKPVAVVVNTHWHGDHVYGNQVYRERFPDVVIVGHEAMRKDLLSRGRARLEDEIESLPASIAERSRWLAEGRGPDGSPLDQTMRERVEYSHRLRSEYLDELRGLTLTPPDVTFSTELTVKRPGRTIRLLHFGAAHTRGDVVVHLPEAGVAAVGDLLEEGAFPYFGDAYPAGWAEALNAVAALGAEVLVPAHGSVQRDNRLLQLHFRLMSALRHEVEVAEMRGLALEEILEQVTLEGFVRELPGSPESVRTAVERTYREARGELER